MARDEYDDRDRGYDDRGDRDDREYDAEDIRTASRKVKPPAVALLVIGILSLLSVAWGVYQYVNFDKEFDAEIEKSQRQQGGDARQQKDVQEMVAVVKDVTKVAMPIGLGLQTLTALVMIFGALRVIPLASRGWGLTAAAMAFVPHLTCLVWLVSLSFGIWAVVTLNNKEVKRGFAAKWRQRTGGTDEQEDDRR